ncbi:MAG: hypothetical protein RKE49_05300 [Oceanicaulis sp.]
MSLNPYFEQGRGLSIDQADLRRVMGDDRALVRHDDILEYLKLGLGERYPTGSEIGRILRRASQPHGALINIFGRSALHTNPPVHAANRRRAMRLAGVLGKAWPLHRLRGFFQAALAARSGAGAFNLHADFVWPMIIDIVAEPFALSGSNVRRIAETSMQLMSLNHVETPNVRAYLALAALAETAKNLIDAMEIEPFEDADSNDMAYALSTSLILPTQLLASAISFSFLQISSAPKLRAELRDYPELRSFYRDEVFRLAGGVFETQPERATCSHRLKSGRLIKRGEIYRCVLGAGNRDPDLFENPECLRLTRTPPSKITFGAGRHRCAGAAFSLQAMEAAVDVFLDGFVMDRIGDIDIKRTPIGYEREALVELRRSDSPSRAQHHRRNRGEPG